MSEIILPQLFLTEQIVKFASTLLTMKIAFALAVSLFCAVSHAQAQTQSLDPLQVRSWAAGCANCHGTNGRSEGGMAALAGVDKDVIVQKMQDYKTGRTPATIMHQLSKGYSDAQIVAIASYFAAQKK